MKGGYTNIDFTGVDLGNLGTVTGIYEKVKTAVETGKPMALYNIVNGTQKFTPIVAYGGVESSTSVFLSFYPITLHISNEDAITM